MKSIKMNEKTIENMISAFGASKEWVSKTDEKDVRFYFNGLQDYIFENIVDEEEINGGCRKAINNLKMFVSKLQNKVIIDDKYLTKSQQRYIKDNIIEKLEEVINAK